MHLHGVAQHVPIAASGPYPGVHLHTFAQCFSKHHSDMRCTFSALSTGSRHDRRAKTELQDYVNGTQLLWIRNSAETLQASFCLLQPPNFAWHSRTALLSSQSTPICTISH